MLTTLVFEEKAIHVYPHETLLDALKRNGFDIAAGCGKKAVEEIIKLESRVLRKSESRGRAYAK